MMVIGLTGSIAMGKSEAARYLAAKGLPVFDSDVEVHKLYDSARGAALIAPYVPQAVVTGKVDRMRLTAAILKDPQLLAQLEKKVHEEIRERRDAFLTRVKSDGAKAAILDIPLLFETGAQKDVDKTIVISAPPDLQRQRALARPGMTPEKFETVLARQMRDDDKKQLADAVILNNSTIQEMQNTLDQLLQNWGISFNA